MTPITPAIDDAMLAAMTPLSPFNAAQFEAQFTALYGETDAVAATVAMLQKWLLRGTVTTDAGTYTIV